MSVLYKPIKIGKMEVKNRFVRSATLENMAMEDGSVSNELIKLLSKLAKGEVGLIIPGYMYIHPFGRVFKHQTGIYNDDLIPGLKKLTKAIHNKDGKIAFQIVHGSMQIFKSLTKSEPYGPSGKILNPGTLATSKEMTEEEIQESIQDFVGAAKRAVEANVDAIQLHAAHGYLINQFLSPFFNQRNDDWGGSDENRFRYVSEIILRIKKIIPDDIPLLIKINSNDYTPKEGITPTLAAKYSEWLVSLGIDGIEVSCGASNYATFHMSRGDIPVDEIIQFLPDNIKPIAKRMFHDMVGKFDLEEGYNLEAAKLIKAKIGSTPLILVGGLHTQSFIEEVLVKNHADLISMSRPFIREPFLVKKFKEGKQTEVSCVSCNRCLAAIPNDYPIRCYKDKWPEEIKPTMYFQ
ncbi:MAG: NADH:flavin oxidoreductase [Candidatus Thorarchaeota archaeon]